MIVGFSVCDSEVDVLQKIRVQINIAVVFANGIGLDEEGIELPSLLIAW